MRTNIYLVILYLRLLQYSFTFYYDTYKISYIVDKIVDIIMWNSYYTKILIKNNNNNDNFHEINDELDWHCSFIGMNHSSELVLNRLKNSSKVDRYTRWVELHATPTNDTYTYTCTRTHTYISLRYLFSRSHESSFIVIAHVHEHILNQTDFYRNW